MLKQISIFAANAKGALGRMTDELAKGRINIYTMLATDSAEFGIVRIIVDDANNAKDLLTKAGYQCRIDFVIAVDMASDAPGTLNLEQDLRQPQPGQCQYPLSLYLL